MADHTTGTAGVGVEAGTITVKNLGKGVFAVVMTFIVIAILFIVKSELRENRRKENVQPVSVSPVKGVTHKQYPIVEIITVRKGSWGRKIPMASNESVSAELVNRDALFMGAVDGKYSGSKAVRYGELLTLPHGKYIQFTVAGNNPRPEEEIRVEITEK